MSQSSAMYRNDQDLYHSHTKMILVGGWSMVLFSLLYVGFTIFIDILVQNQQVMFDLGRVELFKVAAGTEAIRNCLALYSVVPMLLIPASVGAYYAFIEKYEANMRIGMYFATVAAIGMTLSLMMIPSINWYLMSFVQSMNPTQLGVEIPLIKALQSYFGIFVGDVLGMGSFMVWSLICSVVVIRAKVLPHIVGYILLILALIVVLVMFLRYTDLIATIHLVIQVNVIIALWTFIFGIGLISLRRD